MGAWTWGEDGSASLGGVKYELSRDFAGIFLDACRAYDVHAETVRWLEQAAEAFRGGCAFYAGSARNIPALIDSLAMAKRTKMGHASNAAELYRPPGLAKALGDSLEEFLGDARAIVGRM